MKKLMIAAAIVCATAASQAATFTWNSSANVYGIDAAEFTAGLVNGKTYTAGSTSMKKNGSDSGVVWSMIMTITDANGSETLDPYKITSYATTTKPKSAADALSSSKVFKPASDSDPACEVTWTVVYEGKYTDKNGTEWTITSSPIESNSGKFGSNDDLKLTTSAAPASWTATASTVPEPTSGLLLLLGVAGLALRRRRA